MSNVYLVVSNNKSYQCKSTHSSTPYIKVSNSYLDLASTTTKGTQIKFNINNKTYRPKQTYTTTASKSSQYNTTTGYIGVKSSSYNTTTSRTTGGYKLNTYDYTWYTDTTNTNTFTKGKGKYKTYTEKYITDYTDNKTWTSSSSIEHTQTYNYTKSVAGSTTTKSYSYSQNVSELSYLSKINNSCIILSSYYSYSTTTNTQLITSGAIVANIGELMSELAIIYPATSTSEIGKSMSIAWNNRITISSTDTIETNTQSWFTFNGTVTSNINSKTYIQPRYYIMATHQVTWIDSDYFITLNYNNNGQGEVLFSTTQTTETNKIWKSSLTTSFTTNSVSILTSVWFGDLTTSQYLWNGIPATTVSTETNTTKTQNYTTTSNNINNMSSTTALTRTSSRQSNYNTNTEL